MRQYWQEAYFCSSPPGNFMLFSSAIFLFLFLPSFLVIYYLLPKQWHNAFLFAASLLFYAWGESIVVLVLLLSAFINFLAGILIEKGRQRLGLWVSLLGSLSLLFYYKYATFVLSSIHGFAEVFALPIADGLPISPIALPIGISFYTFQGISYTLDVYWGRTRATHSFLDFGTYVAMFPHQIAGPIVRYTDIAAEIASRTLTLDKFGIGAERFIIGLAKKVLLANTFADIADTIFNAPIDMFPVETAWLGIVAYSLQIYYDFSGYSDMAIGLGKMVGFDFKENFNYPYAARSIQDFWRRWHISLSSWFRDYVYIPLGGNRSSANKTYRNLLIVFLVTGLWHGASWNFIAWGLYHGLFLLLERTKFGELLKRTSAPIAHLYTLLVILIGWVLFRADTLQAAVVYLQKMAGLVSVTRLAYPLAYFMNTEVVVSLVIGCLFVAPVYHQIQCFYLTLMGWLKPKPVRVTLNLVYVVGLAGLFIIAVAYLAADTYNPFIYFRF